LQRMTKVRYLFRIPLAVLLVVLVRPLPAQQGNPFLPDTANSVQIQSGLQHGSYRRAMDPLRVATTGVAGRGNAALGDWTLGGRFGYRRESRREVYFSGVADAYNGNPFFWGDSLSGDWRDDIVEAGANLRVPRIGRHGLGLVVGYGTSTGVRTNDPKPLYRLREASVALEYRLQVSPATEVLVRPGYKNVFEENEIGYETPNNAFVIRSHGYGSLVEGSLASMDRRRASSTWEGELAIQRPGGWYVATTASVRTDRVTEALGDPVPDGDYRLTALSLRATYPIGRVEPSLQLGYGQGRGESYLGSAAGDGGYTYRPVRNVFYDGRYGDISVEWKPLALRLLHAAGGSISLESNRYEDALAGSLYEYTNAQADAYARFSGRSFRGGLRLAYRRNLSGAETVAFPTRLNRTLFLPDYRYHTADALLWSLSGRWYCLDRAISPKNSRLWVQLAADGAAAASEMRMGYSLSLGIDFNNFNN